MATKECTVYVVDVGASMGQKRHEREDTDLEWSLRYVWDKLATEVSTGRKTLVSGVIAFRSDETNHDVSDEDAYKNISVVQPVKQLLMPDLRLLKPLLKPSRTNEGDALSAVIIAVQKIDEYCKANKWKKKIVMITNGTGLIDPDDLSGIRDKINQEGIDLVLLGTDFDDLDNGFKEEEKDETKAANEAMLHQLADGCNGVYGSINQAVAELDIPRIKEVKPMVSYKGFLSLGDSQAYESAMAIDVERYPRTMIRPTPSATSFALRAEGGSYGTQDGQTNGHDATDAADGLAPIQTHRAYEVKDENAPGQKRDVDQGDLARGYEYGATIVPISETDQSVFNMETTAAYEIVGFIPVESYPPFISMGRSHFVIPQRNNNKAILALSSLIHALYELDSHAVARLVSKDGREPELVLLSYEINQEFECLYENSLPFYEDVRSYKFPPLDKIVTVSGKTLTVHRNLPDQKLQSAMDDLVETMDLTAFDRDDEGNSKEYLPMDETYSPIYHRIIQVTKYRAVHPEAPVPSPPDIIRKPSKPPQELLEKAQVQLQRLEEAANVKKVPPKTGPRKMKRNPDNLPRSDLNVQELLGNKARPIDPANAVPGFRQAVARLGDDGNMQLNAPFDEFAPIIEDWIRQSFGDVNYERAVEGIRVMREEAVELEVPEFFNSFMRSLKSKLLGGQLGGDRKEMWFKLRRYKLGLIERRISPVSDVDDQIAQEFLSAR